MHKEVKTLIEQVNSLSVHDDDWEDILICYRSKMSDCYRVACDVESQSMFSTIDKYQYQAQISLVDALLALRQI